MRKAIAKRISVILLAVVMMVSFSNFTDLYAQAAAAPPAVPGNVKAVSASYNSIKISWSTVSGATGYAVCRYNSNTKKYDQLAVIKSTSYTDKSLITGTTYTYKAKAYKTANGKTLYGNLSGAVSAKPVLSVPGGFKAVSASYNSITLSWSAVSGATGYVVYRYNPSKKSNDRLAVISGTSYTDKLLTTGKPYSYQVQASRTVNKSSVYGNATGTVSAKPLPAVPGSFKVLSATQNSIKTGWNTVAGANGYEVYRRVTSSGSFSFVKAVTVTNFTDSLLSAGKTYYYQVRAYRTVSGTKVYSGFTSVIAGKTAAAAVSAPVGGSIAEIVSFYNQNANATKAYSGTVQVNKSQGTSSVINSINAPDIIKNKTQELLPNDYKKLDPITFKNGKNIKGGSATLINYLPRGDKTDMSVLEPAGVKSAACVKSGSGWKVTINLKTETVDSLNAIPKYHAQCMDTLKLTEDDIQPFSVTSVKITYTDSSAITALINANGLLDEVHIVEPINIIANLSYVGIPINTDVSSSWKQDIKLLY